MNEQMKKQFIYLSLLLLMAAACSQSDKELAIEKRAISFSSSIGTATRATEVGFETGDAISVYAFREGYDFSTGNYYATNARYVYSNGFMAAGTPIFYPEDESPLSFHAIYPYSINGIGSTFAVEENQDESNHYTLSDLMTAATAPTTEAQPMLTFRHALASIQVNLTNDYEGFSITGVQLCDVITEANVDLINNKFKAVTDGTGKNITMKAVNGNSFKSIFPPQSKEMNSNLVRVNGTKDGTSVSLIGRLDRNTRFDSGVRHTYNLQITSKGDLRTEGEEEEPNPDPTPDPDPDPTPDPDPDPTPGNGHTLDFSVKIDVNIRIDDDASSEGIPGYPETRMENVDYGWFQYETFSTDGLLKYYADQSDPYSEWYQEGSDVILRFSSYYYAVDVAQLPRGMYMYEEGWFLADDEDTDSGELEAMRQLFSGEADQVTFEERDGLYEENKLVWIVTATRMDMTGDEYYADRPFQYYDVDYPYPGDPVITSSPSTRMASQGARRSVLLRWLKHRRIVGQ